MSSQNHTSIPTRAGRASVRRGLGRLTGILGAAALLAGCSTLDAMAVGETHRLDDAPYYVNVGKPVPTPGTCAVLLPAAVDPRIGDAFGYGDRVRNLEPIVAAVNARMRQKFGCLKPGGEPTFEQRPPRVYVGIEDSDFAPEEAVDQSNEYDRFSPMVLHLDKPGAEWRDYAARAIAQAGTTHAIVVHVGMSQYAKGRKGLVKKHVSLGTGYDQPIRFLTAEDKPVEVLHLTGVLVDHTGKPVRVGAEGVMLRDTEFVVQVFDVTRLIDDAELAAVLTSERRKDLPGEPLKLDIALDNLLAQLTRNTPIVPATR